MKRILLTIAIFCGLTAPVASAAPPPGKGYNKSDERGVPPGLAKKPYGLPPGQAKKMWRKGERIPTLYIGPQYYVEPRVYHLSPPRRGYRGLVVDGDAYLVAIANGLIADVVVGALADGGYR